MDSLAFFKTAWAALSASVRMVWAWVLAWSVTARALASAASVIALARSWACSTTTSARWWASSSSWASCSFCRRRVSILPSSSCTRWKRCWFSSVMSRMVWSRCTTSRRLDSLAWAWDSQLFLALLYLEVISFSSAASWSRSCWHAWRALRASSSDFCSCSTWDSSQAVFSSDCFWVRSIYSMTSWR